MSDWSQVYEHTSKRVITFPRDDGPRSRYRYMGRVGSGICQSLQVTKTQGWKDTVTRPLEVIELRPSHSKGLSSKCWIEIPPTHGLQVAAAILGVSEISKAIIRGRESLESCLAVAVLQGDRAAAYALVDRLLDLREGEGV